MAKELRDEALDFKNSTNVIDFTLKNVNQFLFLNLKKLIVLEKWEKTLIQEINVRYHNHSQREKLFEVVTYNPSVIDSLMKDTKEGSFKFQIIIANDMLNMALDRLKNINVEA